MSPQTIQESSILVNTIMAMEICQGNILFQMSLYIGEIALLYNSFY